MDLNWIAAAVGVVVSALVGFYAGFVMGKAVERVKLMKAVQGGTPQSGPGADPRPRS